MRRFGKDYSTASDIWKHYWKEKNKRNSKKQLTNKTKQFIIIYVKEQNKSTKKLKKIKKVVDKVFEK